MMIVFMLISSCIPFYLIAQLKHTQTHRIESISNLCIAKALSCRHKQLRNAAHFNRLVNNTGCMPVICVRLCTCRYWTRGLFSVFVITFYVPCASVCTCVCEWSVKFEISLVYTSARLFAFWWISNVSQFVVTDKPYVAFRIDTIAPSQCMIMLFNFNVYGLYINDSGPFSDLFIAHSEPFPNIRHEYSEQSTHFSIPFSFAY